MDYKDYYKILGVERGAEADDIRKAYRKLAMKYHPDRNPGDKQAEESFKDINEAYQVLNDPQKRARYDQLGSAYSNWEQGGRPSGDFDWSQWFGNQQGGTRVDYGDVGDLFGQDSFSDFFRSIFGGRGGPGTTTRSRRGASSYQQPITISLEEAYRGTTRAFQSDDRQLTVRIPAGVKTGSRVRAAGAAPEGEDLYLHVQVSEDPRFERQGDDLRSTASVDLYTAALGGEAQVQTLDGEVTLKIPPGTQPEQVFRLAGRGMPRLKSPKTRGDLFVRVKVRIPRDLTAEQQELLRRASQLGGNA
ncbi:MAG TPA: DnaJ C-terminal domain-containing protein [Anaerolineales bacterium]|nr:DnaJ C-terminal domain-containing protein [Anaerolineales bacterium]